MIWQASIDGGAALFGWALRVARGLVVFCAVFVILVPALASADVMPSAVQSPCHEVGRDALSASVDLEPMAACGGRVAAPCSTALCAMAGCLSGALLLGPLSARHQGMVLAVRLEPGDEPAAGIGAPPDLRPPIAAVRV